MPGTGDSRIHRMPSRFVDGTGCYADTGAAHSSDDVRPPPHRDSFQWLLRGCSDFEGAPPSRNFALETAVHLLRAMNTPRKKAKSSRSRLSSPPRIYPSTSTHSPRCPLISGTTSNGCQFGVKPPSTQASVATSGSPNRSGIGGIQLGWILWKTWINSAIGCSLSDAPIRQFSCSLTLAPHLEIGNPRVLLPIPIYLHLFGCIPPCIADRGIGMFEPLFSVPQVEHASFNLRAHLDVIWHSCRHS